MAQLITLDNALPDSDPNHYSIVFDEDANSEEAYILIPGFGKQNIMYDYYPVVHHSGASHYPLESASWTDSDPSDGSITSAGNFGGIPATVTHILPPGEQMVTSRWTLSTTDPNGLPATRFFMYLDEDVEPGPYSYTDNVLVVSGSIPTGNLVLLTVHPGPEAGIAQGGDAQATGWAADMYYDLEDDLLYDITFDAAPGGTIDLADLPPHTDPVYGPAYGPEDITSAIEWEIEPGVMSATFEAYLGGVPVTEPLGAVTIIKELLDSFAPEEWNFTGDLGNFRIDARGGEVTFAGVPLGSYNVSEIALPDWACSSTASTSQQGTWSIDFDVYQAETTTVTFRNTYTGGEPVIPEPTTVVLLGVGAMALLKRRKRRG